MRALTPAGPSPAGTVVPPQIPPDAARVVLVAVPSPLRSAVARTLRVRTALVACLDSPRHLPHILSADTHTGTGTGIAVSGTTFEGATVVFATVPQPPRPFGRRQPSRRRTSSLATDFEQAATTARSRGAARVIVLSTVFRYCGSSQPLTSDSPTTPASETEFAAAAEHAAHVFTDLGGDSVILRLGWAYDRGETITNRVLTAARRGWQLIDGDPTAWLSTIAQPDAASAVPFALSIPAGTYNVTDGHPCTQAALNARLTSAAGSTLHPLGEPRWGRGGILFGQSRRIADATFSDLTGWQPRLPHAADAMADLLAAPRDRRP